MTIAGLVDILTQLDGTKQVDTVLGSDVKVHVDKDGNATIE